VERVLFAPRELPSLPPDVAEDPSPFSAWVTAREVQRTRLFRDIPGETLQLLMLIAGEPPPETVDTLRSLQQQLSSRWNLHVILQAAAQSDFTALLTVSGLQKSNRRVQAHLDDSTEFDQLLAAGLATCQDAFVGVIYPGDVWAPDAVGLLLTGLAPDCAVYGDEDVLTVTGSHIGPKLKPAYSSDFLLSSSYVGRPLAFGPMVHQRLTDTLANSAIRNEHDLAIRVCEFAHHVDHVAEVLCHRMASAMATEAPATFESGHITAALQRRGESGVVHPGPVVGTFNVSRHAATTRASIIIPFRDEPRFLRACIDSIDATKGTQEVDFVLIDNGSVQPETATLLDRLVARNDVHLIEDDRPFNWAALNNLGAESATGQILVFLNNDIEAQEDGWLSTLCAQAQRPSIGAVGARLIYPDGRLQHCGVVIGLGGAAGHTLVGLQPNRTGYLHMAAVTRECAAVTGACLATRREVFSALSGFDESLGVDLNDIDYCLRVQVKGWRVLVDPSVELVHYESPSRGTAGDTKDIAHFIDRWEGSIRAGDPYLNANLTRADATCRLRGPHEEGWWQQWRLNLNSM
jgi:GT2 family glycosyltransferase